MRQMEKNKNNNSSNPLADGRKQKESLRLCSTTIYLREKTFGWTTGIEPGPAARQANMLSITPLTLGPHTF